jgi:hypothetical protein
LAATPLTVNPQNGSEIMTSEYFDVPTALLFADGSIAGVQAFRAMLNNSSLNCADPAASMLKIIAEAVATVHDPLAGTAQRSAAVKLLELVAKSLEFQAKNSSHTQWLDAKQREAERCRQVVLRLEHRKIQLQARENARFQSFMAAVTAY